MRRLRPPVSLVLLLCVLAAAAAASAASAAVSGDAMVNAINWARVQAGLRPLRRSHRLLRSAAARADVLMRADVFAHPSRLRVPTFDRVGEVLELHGGRRPRVVRTLRLWANSPGHRYVLTDRRFRWIGAARSRGRFRGHRATIWVVRLGRH